jgi:hypothetical protein
MAASPSTESAPRPGSPVGGRRPFLGGRAFLGLASLVAASALAAAVLVLGPIGSPSLILKSPLPGEVVGIEGVEVVVGFAAEARVEPATFRVLLNGADVTPGFVTGENGAWGRLHTLLDGENVLRVEVFARRGWASGLLVEEHDEVRVVHRRPLDADRG